MENTTQKTHRFDEWEEVDCNECSHYWDNSCDGVKKESTRLCNSFLATRNVVLPSEIKWLKRAIKRIWWVNGVLGAVILTLILYGLGVW